MAPLKNLPALDLGCGSGRHLKLLSESGFIYPVGTDISMNGLMLAKDINGTVLVQSENKALPFKNSSFGSVVAWGSLHYTRKINLPLMIDEIKRVLITGGRLSATLRSSADTCLKSGTLTGNDEWTTDLADISGTTVSFFDEMELKDLFSDFTALKYGLIERTLVGDLTKKVSHWVFTAEKR